VRLAAAAHSGTQRTAERIGELVRASSEAAMHTAKILRTAKTTDGIRLGLWPNPGSGVRNAKFTPDQLVNLLLALGCGDPIQAADTVATFRSLRAEESASRTHRRRLPHNPLMPDPEGYQETVTTTHAAARMLGPTFGDDLNFMVEELASDDADRAEIRALFRTATIIITLEPQPSAEIVFPSDKNSTDSVRYAARQRQSANQTTKHESAMFARHCTFYGSALEAVASIWIDSQAALHQPRSENAATPAREAASPNQPTTERERPGRETPRKVATRERNLKHSVSAAGSPFTKERPNVRTFSAVHAGG
jgi:hypothetical protein